MNSTLARYRRAVLVIVKLVLTFIIIRARRDGISAARADLKAPIIITYKITHPAVLRREIAGLEFPSAPITLSLVVSLEF